MYNQSGLIGNINTDIFKMRDFMIKDMMMKNNIESNRSRSKYNKNSLLKEHKIINIKKPSSPNRPVQKPIKTFLPVPMKTPQNNKSINFNNYGYLPSSPSVRHRPTSKNSMNHSYLDTTDVKPTIDGTVIKGSYNKNQGYKNHYLDAKNRNVVNKGKIQEKQNEQFGNKLKRISSPLSKDSLNNSYSRLKEYRNIAKKVGEKEDVNQRKINFVKNFLPPLLTSPGHNYSNCVNNTKSREMLALGRINNFRKFGS